jgi:ribosomal protein S6--L-glutamate ligase
MQGPRKPNALIAPVADLLARAGATVELLHPDDDLTDVGAVRVEHDLYVLKSSSELGLSLAGALHDAGAAILNPYPAAARCRDKIRVTRALAAAGIPVPQTWITRRHRRLRDLLADGPVVIKPYRGARGVGVFVVRSVEELDALDLSALKLSREPILAQRLHPPDGPDCKLYGIGEHVFGVRRGWPSTKEEVGEPFAPDDRLRDIVRRSAAALDLELIGVDVVISGGEPVVVDVASFPSYKGVPGAAELLAEAIGFSASSQVRALK